VPGAKRAPAAGGELFDTLTKTKGAIKVFCEVAPLDADG
jgi:hypothetical protein